MPGNDIGLYIPTTNVWDTNQIQSLQDESPQLKELLVRLYQNLNRMALAVNLKESGLFDLNEFVTGEQWFPNPVNADPSLFSIGRPIYRTVINFGALPNTGSKSVAHNITCYTQTSFTRIYGCATKPTTAFSYIPLPFASPVLAENIKIEVDATNVVITTGSDRTAYTTSYVILEYLQQ
jgi:hypothetical protein